ARHTIAEYNTYFEQYQFSKALEAAWGLVAAVDKYIVENEPWALGEKPDENNRARLATVLYTSAEALRIVTALAHPVIPESTARIWTQLGLGDIKNLDLTSLKWGQLRLGTKLGEIQPVFPRADKSTVERMQKMEEQGRPGSVAVESKPEASAAPVAAKPSVVTADGKIGIEDFSKVELRVGLVKVAERVKNADKLLRL